MSHENALNLLHKKLFLFPDEFSSQDQAEMERLKHLVYSSTHSASNVDLNTTPEASSAFSDGNSSSNSVQSDYTKNVLSNRFFKHQFASVTFASISPFLDDCKNHLQTAANFHAMFINFIR